MFFKLVYQISCLLSENNTFCSINDAGQKDDGALFKIKHLAIIE